MTIGGARTFPGFVPTAPREGRKAESARHGGDRHGGRPVPGDYGVPMKCGFASAPEAARALAITSSIDSLPG